MSSSHFSSVRLPQLSAPELKNSLEAEEMDGKKGAPKRKDGDASSPAEEWNKSKCRNSVLLRLIGEGLLQAKEVVH